MEGQWLSHQEPGSLRLFFCLLFGTSASGVKTTILFHRIKTPVANLAKIVMYVPIGLVCSVVGGDYDIQELADAPDKRPLHIKREVFDFRWGLGRGCLSMTKTLLKKPNICAENFSKIKGS